MTPARAFLFVGMGDWEVAYQQWARDRGLQVIAANRNPEAASLRHADIAWVVDGKDVEGLVTRALTCDECAPIAGIYTGTELFFTTSVAAGALGVPGISAKAALAGQHKRIMRDCFTRAGIRTIEGVSIRSSAELPSALERLGLPLILKPADGIASLGVSVVREMSELDAAFAAAHEASISGTVVMETYIDGSLHDANGLFWEGRFHPLGVSDKWAGPLPYCVVERLACPSVLNAEEQAEAHALLERGARAMGIEQGPVKADLIRGPDGLQLLEIAPRFHGPLGSMHLLPRALGITPVQVLLDAVCSGRVDPLPSPATGGRHIAIQAVPIDADVNLLVGQPEAALPEGIEAVLPQVWARPEGPVYRSNYEVLAYVVGSGKDHAQAAARVAEFMQQTFLQRAGNEG